MKRRGSKKRLQNALAVEQKQAAPRRRSSRTSSKAAVRKRHSPPEETRTLRSSDSKDESVALNRAAPPVRVSSGFKRNRKTKRVTQAVAIHRLQRWIRSRILLQRISVRGRFVASVQARKVLEESLEAIRVLQAKRTLKLFFNDACSAARWDVRRSRSSGGHTRRGRESIAYRGKTITRPLDEEEKEALEIIQAAFLAKLAFLEILKREAKNMRAAASLIVRYWVRSPLYRYLRHLSLNRLALRVLAQHETIERREIMRRYYKALIEMHQSCYNAKVVVENGCGTRHVPLHYSLLLFSLNSSLKEIMDNMRKPHGTGPYHPYSIERVPEDFQTIRILERRFMFSKEERRLLQEEGILEVNEPPDEYLSFFDPNFVFGSVLDYLRPGEFLDKLRSNHPSLRLGIRRTSSLVLDSDFQILEENGIQSTDKGTPIALPSPWSLRRNCAAFHTLICQLGYINATEVDGSFRPMETNVRKWPTDSMDFHKESVQQLQQLYADRVFVVSPPYNSCFPFSSFAMHTPVVQDLLLSEYVNKSQKSANAVLLDGGNPISNSVLQPGGKGSPRKDRRGGGRSHRGRGADRSFAKYFMSQKKPKASLWRHFSSARALGDTWKTFLERANLNECAQKHIQGRSWPASSEVGGGGGRGISLMEESSSSSPLGGRDSRSGFSLTEAPQFSDWIGASMSDPLSLEKESCSMPVGNTRKYKHLTLVFGTPEAREEEKGLEYFLHQATKGMHKGSLSGVHSGRNSDVKHVLSSSTGVSTEVDRTDKEEQENQGLFSRLGGENKAKASAGLSSMEDRKTAVYVNASVEIERLLIKENIKRQDLWRRFMLIFESIQKMCQLETQRKEAILHKFLQRDM